MCIRDRHHDYLKVTQVQDDLLYLYKQDYKKYTPIVNAECLQDIMDQVALKIGSQTVSYTHLDVYKRQQLDIIILLPLTWMMVL